MQRHLLDGLRRFTQLLLLGFCSDASRPPGSQLQVNVDAWLMCFLLPVWLLVDWEDVPSYVAHAVVFVVITVMLWKIQHMEDFVLQWNFLKDVQINLNRLCSPEWNTSFLCCSDEESQVTGSCEVKAPRSWCVMNLTDLYKVASTDTECTSGVGPHGGSSESSTWLLSNVGEFNS